MKAADRPPVDHVQRMVKRRREARGDVDILLVTDDGSPEEINWLRVHGIDPAVCSRGSLIMIDRLARRVEVLTPAALERDEAPLVFQLESPPLPFPR